LRRLGVQWENHRAGEASNHNHLPGRREGAHAPEGGVSLVHHVRAAQAEDHPATRARQPAGAVVRDRRLAAFECTQRVAFGGKSVVTPVGSFAGARLHVIVPRGETTLREHLRRRERGVVVAQDVGGRHRVLLHQPQGPLEHLVAEARGVLDLDSGALLAPPALLTEGGLVAVPAHEHGGQQDEHVGREHDGAEPEVRQAELRRGVAL